MVEHFWNSPAIIKVTQNILQFTLIQRMFNQNSSLGKILICFNQLDYFVCDFVVFHRLRGSREYLTVNRETLAQQRRLVSSLEFIYLKPTLTLSHSTTYIRGAANAVLNLWFHGADTLFR